MINFILERNLIGFKLCQEFKLLIFEIYKIKQIEHWLYFYITKDQNISVLLNMQNNISNLNIYQID